MASGANYVFSLQTGGVQITSDLGYNAIWQGLVNITTSQPDVVTNVPKIMIVPTQGAMTQQLTMNFDDILTIDGVSRAGTLSGTIIQLNDIFQEAYASAGGGGGGGATISEVAFRMGTLTPAPNVTYTQLANGDVITNAALAAAGSVLQVVVGNIYSEPVTSTGYTYDGSTLTFAGGDPTDINVYVLISTP